MTTNIEPTEEQKQAVMAIAELEGSRVQKWRLDDIARLLAEREHRLREEYQAPTQDVVIGKLRADLDAARAEVEHFRKRLGETDVEACEARTELTAARARIAELETVVAAVDKLDERDKRSTEREAAHLAHIKALNAHIDAYRERAHPADIHEIEGRGYDVEGEVAK